MVRFTFFKRREPRQFQYMPRHFDPDKEDLERRIRNAQAELGMVDESGEKIRREINFREQAAMSWKKPSVKSSNAVASFRLIAILFAICALFYYIYSRIDGLIAQML